MKNLEQTNQRLINILSRSVKKGFIFYSTDSLNSVCVAAEDYLLNHSRIYRKRYCSVSIIDKRQHIICDDGFGFTYNKVLPIGETFDFSIYDVGDSIGIGTFIDTNGNKISMYYLVGETEYN